MTNSTGPFLRTLQVPVLLPQPHWSGHTGLSDHQAEADICIPLASWDKGTFVFDAQSLVWQHLALIICLNSVTPSLI